VIVNGNGHNVAQSVRLTSYSCAHFVKDFAVSLHNFNNRPMFIT
jgi:hypothetical protein